MWNFTKRKIDAEMLQPEEQPGSKKPNIGRPFSQSGSSFQPWQPSWQKGLGIAEASSSGGPHVANFNKTDVQDNNNMNMENSNPDHADKNPIDVGGATSGAGAAGGGDDDNAAGTDAAQSGSGSIAQPDMDPKRLKRILANRASAQRSRLRKNEYMADLEDNAKTFKNKICFLQPQIEAHKNRQRLLQIEQHQLRLQMAIREKQRVLQEVEIEKKKAEVNRLSELQRKLIAETRARMQNTGAAMHHISNSNMNPSSSFGRLFCLDPNQAQNGVETSRLQTAISQQPQNQSQMWMGKWNNGQTSTPNLNFVKSKPANK